MSLIRKKGKQKRKFKIGDIVVGNAKANSYNITKESVELIVRKLTDTDFVGEIVGTSRKFFLNYDKFDLKEESKDKKEEQMKTSNQKEKSFIEGLDVRIKDDLFNPWDDELTSYTGEIGKILSYSVFSEDDDCWVMDVQFSDGEVLEVLESDVCGYVSPKSKKIITTKPKDVFFEPAKPVKESKPYKKETVDYLIEPKYRFDETPVLLTFGDTGKEGEVKVDVSAFKRKVAKVKVDF